MTKEEIIDQILEHEPDPTPQNYREKYAELEQLPIKELKQKITTTRHDRDGMRS